MEGIKGSANIDFSKRHFILSALCLSIASAMYPAIANASCPILSDSEKAQMLEGLNDKIDTLKTVIKHFYPMPVGAAVGYLIAPALGIAVGSGAIIGLVIGTVVVLKYNKEYIRELGIDSLNNMMDAIHTW